MVSVYILRCVDGTLYIGMTDNLDERLNRHNQGRGSRFTKSRRLLTLVHVESYPTRAEATKRERQPKGWTMAKKEALIERDFELLKRL